MGAKITKIDTDGVITNPNTIGDLSIDNHVAGGDAGRMYYNDGIEDIAVARKDEIDNIDNTSDADKPVSTAQQTELDLKANTADVVTLADTQTITGDKTFSGIVEVPTQATDDNSTKAASTAFVQQELATNIGFTDAGTGLSSVGGTVKFYPYGLSTATTHLHSGDYVVVSDSTVPKKITLQNLSNEMSVLPKNACTAWVNFDGTDGTIKDSFNVSSVVNNGNGTVTIGLVGLTKSNYAVAYGRETKNNGYSGMWVRKEVPKTSTSITFNFGIEPVPGSLGEVITTQDATDCYVIIQGGK